MGAGGDKAARQDLFATRVPAYAEQEVIGAAPGARDRYDTTHPLYTQIAELAQLREQHPAPADGAMVPRHGAASSGILAFSRIDPRTGVEYVVALNNSQRTQELTFVTASPRLAFEPVYGTDAAVTAADDGQVSVSVPALSAVVYRASAPMPEAGEPATITLDLPDGASLERRQELSVGRGHGFRAGELLGAAARRHRLDQPRQRRQRPVHRPPPHGEPAGRHDRGVPGRGPRPGGTRYAAGVQLGNGRVSQASSPPEDGAAGAFSVRRLRGSDAPAVLEAFGSVSLA